MQRLWPRSVMGQMLLAVAVALLIVQGVGAFLVWRAQSEMREAGLVHAIAFKLVGEIRGGLRGEDHLPPPYRYRPRGPFIPVGTSDRSPIGPDEQRFSEAEARLGGILASQGINANAIEIARRPVSEDPIAARWFSDHGELHAHLPPSEGKVLVAGVQLEGGDPWLVVRVRQRRDAADLVWPLAIQTLLIYLVLVGALALILRRITRPLAALTDRTERFALTRDADGQIEPQGPQDMRRLIVAHNLMEARIAGLLDEKDIMLGAIGHDLKTPLAALRVRIESVEDETERTRMAETIEDIARSLDDILSLARVGRPTDLPERSELSALIAAVVEEYEDMGEPVELGRTERIALDLRPTWLRRALRNLIDNAVRYGSGAKVSLRREGDCAVIAVEDRGPGIPEDSIAEMMNPFTRGDPSRNMGTGGAGLGLALARAVAEQHGGTLRLENARKDGTVKGLVAELTLPLR